MPSVHLGLESRFNRYRARNIGLRPMHRGAMRGHKGRIYGDDVAPPCWGIIAGGRLRGLECGEPEADACSEIAALTLGPDASFVPLNNRAGDEEADAQTG